jgi:hypothetical protein
MSQYSQLRAVTASAFDGFIEALCDELGLSGPDRLPDGVGALSSAKALTEYAVSRAQRFAALRWAEVRDEGAMLVETFFVCPATRPAMSGLRRLGLASEALELPFAAAWELVTRSKEQPAQARHPTFLELAALLASDGQAPLAHDELLTKVHQLSDELDYLRLVVSDQTDELEVARENLKAGYEHRGELEDFLKSAQPLWTDNPLANLPAWAAENRERIVVLPRALNGAKKSQFEDPALVMRSLELLAGPFREHRLGRMSKSDYEAAQNALGVQLAGSIATSVAGMQGEAYFVHWAGRRRLMDLHLTKGGGRDHRYCMRIYFFWDDGSGRCVVGSLPAHLSNSLS